MLGVLRVVCTVVGAVVLYSVLMALLWGMVMWAGRRRAAVNSARLTAAEALAVRPDPAAPDGTERRARSWEELPTWLWRERPWAVAVVLLGGPALRDRTAPFVDFANRSIDWPGMLEAAGHWPTDQRLLVRSAYEMAYETPGEATRSPADPVSLRDLVAHLDDDEVERLRVAMQIRRGRLEPEDGITAVS